MSVCVCVCVCVFVCMCVCVCVWVGVGGRIDFTQRWYRSNNQIQQHMVILGRLCGTP